MILENDLKIHVFLATVELAAAVPSVVESAVASRFKDPALVFILGVKYEQRYPSVEEYLN